jgi:hypothetical protein
VSVFTYNEMLLCLYSLAWGAWVMSYAFAATPFSIARLIFALIALVPGLLLLAIQIPPVSTLLMGKQWAGLPVSVRLRWGVHFFFVTVWLLTALAVLLSSSDRHVHCLPYVVIALIHAGKVFRLAHFE